MIVCVVFDFDGTLVDSNQVKQTAFYDVTRAYDPGGSTVSEILRRYPQEDRYGLTRRIAVELTAQGRIPPQTKTETLGAQLAEAYTATCEQSIMTCQEVPGASEILKWLSEKGIPAFVNSRTPTEALKRLVELRGLAPYLAGIYGSPHNKRENLEAILHQLHIQPETMLFVGDSDDDLIAAFDVRCKFVGVRTDHTRRFLRVPERQIDHLDRLKDLVETM